MAPLICLFEAQLHWILRAELDTSMLGEPYPRSMPKHTHFWPQITPSAIILPPPSSISHCLFMFLQAVWNFNVCCCPATQTLSSLLFYISTWGFCVPQACFQAFHMTPQWVACLPASSCVCLYKSRRKTISPSWLQAQIPGHQWLPSSLTASAPARTCHFPHASCQFPSAWNFAPAGPCHFPALPHEPASILRDMQKTSSFLQHAESDAQFCIQSIPFFSLHVALPVWFFGHWSRNKPSPSAPVTFVV